MSEKKESGRHLLRAVWFALGRLLTFLPARDVGRNGHFEQMLGFFATREDVQALAGDWQRVGADLHKAMGTYRHGAGGGTQGKEGTAALQHRATPHNDQGPDKAPPKGPVCPTGSKGVHPSQNAEVRASKSGQWQR